MELIKHTDFIWEYKNCVPEYICEEFTKSSSKIPWISDNRNSLRNNDAANLTSTNSPLCNYLDQLAWDAINPIHLKYLKTNPLVNLNFPRNSKLKFGAKFFYRKYSTKDYYAWHSDISPENNYIISYILYLNDDYDGGATLFHQDRLKIKGTTGSILCFPCGISLLHKSTKISRGEKHIIWVCYEFVS